MINLLCNYVTQTQDPGSKWQLRDVLFTIREFYLPAFCWRYPQNGLMSNEVTCVTLKTFKKVTSI